MARIQVSDHDWSIVVQYWKDLQKHLNQPDDLKKIDFLNRVIFKSAGVNRLHSQSSATVTTAKTAGVITDQKDRINISSISIETMSEIMNEIDNDLSKREKKVDDSKAVDDEIKIDSKIKTFIVEPV